MVSKLEQSKQEANGTRQKISEMLKQKSMSGFNKSLDDVKTKMDEIGKSVQTFGKRISSLIASTLIFNVLSSGLRKLQQTFISLLKTDDQFNASLNQIKANLMTAFAPIYNAIIPALNSMMNAISKVTGTIAQLVASMFNMNLKQSSAQAQKLSKSLNGLSKSGDKASGSLASFDKLEVLSDTDTGGSSGGGSNTGIDYSGDIQTSSALLDFLNKIKESLSGIDFSNLNESLAIFKEKLSSFGDIVGGALWWVWENLLVPLASWTISYLLPAFLDVLSGALSVINAVLTNLQPIWQWFYDNFLKPVAKWTGGIIVDILDGIASALDWISQNEIAVDILTALAIAIGLVAGAIGLYNTVMAVANVVTGIFVAVTSPITLIILAIVAALTTIIAIIIICVKHWDDITAAISRFATMVKDFVIKEITSMKNTIKNTVDDVINRFNTLKNKISSVMQSIKNVVSSVWNGIWNVIRKIINSILGGVEKLVNSVIKGFNKMTQAMNKMSFDVPDWVPVIGGEKFGFNLKESSTISLPRLAEGAVIPPRQEFAAILGDQKHGTNIEAPLETIKDAVRDVLNETKGMSSEEREIIFRNLTLIAQFGTKSFQKLTIDSIRAEEKETGTTLLLN